MTVTAEPSTNVRGHIPALTIISDSNDSIRQQEIEEAFRSHNHVDRVATVSIPRGDSLEVVHFAAAGLQPGQVAYIELSGTCQFELIVAEFESGITVFGPIAQRAFGQIAQSAKKLTQIVNHDGEPPSDIAAAYLAGNDFNGRAVPLGTEFFAARSVDPKNEWQVSAPLLSIETGPQAATGLTPGG